VCVRADKVVVNWTIIASAAGQVDMPCWRGLSECEGEVVKGGAKGENILCRDKDGMLSNSQVCRTDCLSAAEVLLPAGGSEFPAVALAPSAL
jgi:hypothetical protein